MSENHAAQIRDLLNKESLEQPKVLLVEDSQFDMTLIKTLLEEYFPLTLIDHAPTRIDGLRLLKCEQYDVILLDLYLPDSISLKDIQDFRDLAADTPIFIFTSLFNQKTQKAAKEYGANGIISKDEINKNTFDAIVKNAVDNVVNA
ncbi:MAG: response regulator transcription factor [Alphaproteobacteria bacterium]|nr:response regulator transcription factor [Alphaproteobacteria bacterium]